MEQRLIDADALREEWLYENGTFEPNDVLDSIDCQPTVDAVPVVRCGECKYHTAYRCKNDMALWKHACGLGHGTIGDEWFCADGERRS